MQELYNEAEALGVTIVEALLPEGVRGEYVHKERLIKLTKGMSERQKRSTLAHELGHAFHGHTKPQNGADRRRQERQANDYAARLLITPEAYAAAERIHGCHVGGLAHSLGVTPAVVQSWRSLWKRTRRHFPIAS